MNSALTISLASIATVVVICGVYYYFRKKPVPKVKKVDPFRTSDVLEWIDKVSNEITPKEKAKYLVKVLPNSSTNKLLSKPHSDVYAAIFVEQHEGKNTIIAQQFYQAVNIADELVALKNDNIIEIPIEY